MPVPYGLLNTALRVIGSQKFKLRRFAGREISAEGLPLDTYAPAVECFGSIQPADQALYELLGLDFEKELRQVWTQEPLKALEDGQNAPDILIFEGKVWNIIKVTPWNFPNGWQNVTVQLAPEDMQVYANED